MVRQRTYHLKMDYILQICKFESLTSDELRTVMSQVMFHHHASYPATTLKPMLYISTSQLVYCIENYGAIQWHVATWQRKKGSCHLPSMLPICSLHLSRFSMSRQKNAFFLFWPSYNYYVPISKCTNRFCSGFEHIHMNIYRNMHGFIEPIS
jgi:hypothetical protein